MARQRGLALQDAAKREWQPFGIDVLEQVAGGTYAKGVEEVRVTARDREHHDRRVGNPLRDLLGGTDAVAGHLDVEQAHIGTLPLGRLDRGWPVLGLGADLEPAALE